MKILLVADDLTGALDSSVAYSEHGFSVLCALAPEHVGRVLDLQADVVAVSTNSREITEKEAVHRIERIMLNVRTHPDWRDATVFKKVDSRLKGHVAAEVCIVAQDRSEVLVCPAIPRLGRFVKNGAVCGAGVTDPIPVAERVGCQPEDVIDAVSDADLDSAVSFYGTAALFVGAAGLAEALARRHAPAGSGPKTPDLQVPSLFAIGSRDPVTLAQLGGFTPLSAPNGIVPEMQGSTTPLQMIQLTRGAETVEPAQAGERFADGISELLTRARPASLFACGGETAAAIAARVGCGILRVEGEALPGLPVSRMLDGMEGLTLITKSGGFGAPDTLVKLAEKFVASPVDRF